MTAGSGQISEIWQKDERTLVVGWIDGRHNEYDVVELRRACPCAACVDEMTGKRLLNESDVSDSVRPISIDSVGRYGLKITFSDGHRTGIYTFDFLSDFLSRLKTAAQKNPAAAGQNPGP